MKKWVFSLVSLFSTLCADNTEFMFSLYPALEEESKNLVFSPHSIASCLSMVYIGARGETENQMRSVLHVEGDQKELAAATQKLTASLMPAKDSFSLTISNALWVDQETFLLSDFRYAIENSFKAHLFMLNFNAPEMAVSKINDWIAAQTEDKIRNLLTPQDINALTRLVLTNAVYFKGAWMLPFDSKATKKKSFYPPLTNKIDVAMMHQTASFPYYENELLQAVSLPFQGKTRSDSSLACFILLPKSPDNFSTMMQELPEHLNEWLTASTPQKIAVEIPKFSLTSRFDLNDPLKKLGMEDAFSQDANFAGIDGMRDLLLNKVVAETFFSLDENGVVAAAATAASIGVTSTPPQKPLHTFIADHPFLFFIVDTTSFEVLFMGKYEQPSPL